MYDPLRNSGDKIKLKCSLAILLRIFRKLHNLLTDYTIL